MYELDANGKPTGNYITEVDRAEYYKKLHAYKQELDKKYPGPENFYQRQTKTNDWLVDNREFIDGRYVPKKSKFSSPQFNKLSTAQKKYYATFMAIKNELDELLPAETTRLEKAVMMRKDFLERVVKSSNIKEGVEQVVDNLKDLFVRRIDDTDFGNATAVGAVTDFKGYEVNSLPIYYVKRLENMEALSKDASSTLIAYAHMAYDFNAMNQVINALELGRDVLRKREIQQTVQETPKEERITHMGRTIVSKLFKREG